MIDRTEMTARHARILKKMSEFGESAIESLVCPIGMPGISGKAPGVVAIAVAAQLLAQVGVQRAAQSAGTTVAA